MEAIFEQREVLVLKSKETTFQNLLKKISKLKDIDNSLIDVMSKEKTTYEYTETFPNPEYPTFSNLETKRVKKSVPATSYTLKVITNYHEIREWNITGLLDIKEGMAHGFGENQVSYDLIEKYIKNSETPHCDHCNSERLRNKIIVVENKEAGKSKIVGGNCISYYLGVKYENVLKILAYLSEVQKWSHCSNFDHEGSEFGKSYNNNEYYSTKLILKIAYYLTNKFGFYKTDHENSTKGKIFNSVRHFYAKLDSDIFEDCERELHTIVSSVDDKDFDKFLSWIDSKDEKESNYFFNIKELILQEDVKDNAFGILASVPFSYFKDIEFQTEKQLKNKEIAKFDKLTENSTHLGELGQKEKFDYLKIYDVIYGEGQYGEWTLYKMLDDNNNMVNKFGVISNKFIIEQSEGGKIVGCVIRCTAKIKEHSEYKDKKVTMLGRLSKF